MSFFEFPHTRTYDSDLGWLIKHTKTQDEAIEAIDHWVEVNGKKIDDFYQLYLMMIQGNLPQGVQDGIEKWMKENAVDLIGDLIKMVFFGLSTDGHFVAYIPDSWSDIIFGTTGYDDFPFGIDFGHLTLSY